MENFFLEDLDTITNKAKTQVYNNKDLIKLLMNEYKQAITKDNRNDKEAFNLILEKAINRSIIDMSNQRFMLTILISSGKFNAIIQTLLKTYVYIYFIKYLQMLKMYILTNTLSELTKEVKQDKLTKNDTIVKNIRTKFIKKS